MRRLLRIFKARGLWLGLVLALSVAGGALFQLNYVNANLAATPWPMFHHDLQHTGRSPYNGPASPWLKWSYTTGNSVGYTSPAIGSDGTIYVCSDDRNLYAINPNGSFKWSYTTGSASRTSPAIGSDGTIYVGATDNKLYAISDNGSFKWSYTTGTIYSSPAIGSDGTIYFGSENNKLNAVSDNGSFKWSYNAFGDSVESSPAIGSDGTIYVGSVDNKLYAISDNGSFGSLKWSYTTGNYVTSSPAIGSDGTIYVGSRDSKLYAISDNGSFKWSCTTGNQIFSSPAIGSDGTIYVGSYFDNKLWAINPNGSFKWSYTTGGNVDSSPAIGGDGTIYVGSHDNKLYAINPTDGSFKWSYTTGGYVGSPAIGSDGTIYVGSNDHKLYAIMQQPAPTVTSVSPNSGNQGQTLNNVTITGTYFTGATVVSFGAGITVTSFIVNSDTQITDNITIAAGATPGVRAVSVTTPGGTATLPNGFTVLQPTQSVSTATGTGIATFTTSGGSITSLTAWAQSQLACRARPDLNFPHGFFSFNITNLTPGATVTITITLPSNMPKGTQYWKCVNGQWVDCTSILGSNDGDNIITLTITDGGLGDADGQANGTIVDPGGPCQLMSMPSQPRPSPSLLNNFKPAQMSLQYLSINPQQTAANQPVTILTNVVNTGDEAGSLNVALKINGQAEQTRTVSVGPQAAQPVKFTVTKAQPGTYAIDIGGQRGSFTVLGNGSNAHTSVNVGLILILLMGILILATVVVLLATRRHPA